MTSAAEQRQAVADLSGLAAGDLAAVWPELAVLSVEDARDGLIDVLPALGETYGSAAAALAADWFDEAREQAGVSGRFSPVLAPQVASARWVALARWGVDPLLGAEPNSAAALTRIVGGLQRTIADQHRTTITDSAIADPKAAGWRRVGVGDSCGFCRMLIGRGGVYSEKGVEFKSHDHCNCAAAPSWDTNARKTIGIPYQASRKNRSDDMKARDNARAREWIADH